jgi:hypothetical protein
VQLDHRLIGEEARRPSDGVACCRDAGPFVFDTNLRLPETADFPDADDTVPGALLGRLMRHGSAIIIQGRSHCTQEKSPTSPARDPARCVND